MYTPEPHSSNTYSYPTPPSARTSPIKSNPSSNLTLKRARSTASGLIQYTVQAPMSPPSSPPDKEPDSPPARSQSAPALEDPRSDFACVAFSHKQESLELLVQTLEKFDKEQAKKAEEEKYEGFAKYFQSPGIRVIPGSRWHEDLKQYQRNDDGVKIEEMDDIDVEKEEECDKAEELTPKTMGLFLPKPKSTDQIKGMLPSQHEVPDQLAVPGLSDNEDNEDIVEGGGEGKKKKNKKKNKNKKKKGKKGPSDAQATLDDEDEKDEKEVEKVIGLRIAMGTEQVIEPGKLEVVAEAEPATETPDQSARVAAESITTKPVFEWDDQPIGSTPAQHGPSSSYLSTKPRFRKKEEVRKYSSRLNFDFNFNASAQGDVEPDIETVEKEQELSAIEVEPESTATVPEADNALVADVKDAQDDDEAEQMQAAEILNSLHDGEMSQNTPTPAMTSTERRLAKKKAQKAAKAKAKAAEEAAALAATPDQGSSRPTVDTVEVVSKQSSSPAPPSPAEASCAILTSRCILRSLDSKQQPISDEEVDKDLKQADPSPRSKEKPKVATPPAPASPPLEPGWEKVSKKVRKEKTKDAEAAPTPTVSTTGTKHVPIPSLVISSTKTVPPAPPPSVIPQTKKSTSAPVAPWSKCPRAPIPAATSAGSASPKKPELPTPGILSVTAAERVVPGAGPRHGPKKKTPRSASKAAAQEAAPSATSPSAPSTETEKVAEPVSSPAALQFGTVFTWTEGAPIPAHAPTPEEDVSVTMPVDSPAETTDINRPTTPTDESSAMLLHVPPTPTVQGPTPMASPTTTVVHEDSPSPAPQYPIETPSPVAALEAETDTSPARNTTASPDQTPEEAELATPHTGAPPQFVKDSYPYRPQHKTMRVPSLAAPSPLSRSMILPLPPASDDGQTSSRGSENGYSSAGVVIEEGVEAFGDLIPTRQNTPIPDNDGAKEEIVKTASSEIVRATEPDMSPLSDTSILSAHNPEAIRTYRLPHSSTFDKLKDPVLGESYPPAQDEEPLATLEQTVPDDAFARDCAAAIIAPTARCYTYYGSQLTKPTHGHGKGSDKPRLAGLGAPTTSAEAYADSTPEAFTVSTLGEFFGTYMALRRQVAAATERGPHGQKGAQGLGLFGYKTDRTVSFFVSGVKPMWEDEQCGHGGKIVITGNPHTVSFVVSSSDTA
jgi:hypothetical protein